MSGVRWGGRSKNTDGDDSDENSDEAPSKLKKKTSISFLTKNTGKPPKIKGRQTRGRASSADSTSDCDRSVDDDSRTGTPKKTRFRGRLKRNKSADESDYSESSQGNAKGKGFFGKINQKRGGGSGNERYESERSADDDSVKERKGPAKILKKKMGGLLKGGSSGKPPRGGGMRRSNSEEHIKGVTFSGDSSVRDSSVRSSAHQQEDSEYGYDNAGIPQPKTEKKPNRERARYSVYHGQGTRAVKKKFRVRPYRAFSEAVYMTEEEIYADSLQPSKRVEFMKSFLVPSSRSTKNMDIPDQIRTRWGTPNHDGRIGSVRIEVLGCVSLNRSKPDVCAYIISGDAAFCTDVIQGYRSPMWPCACKRAAVFPVHHAFAKVFVGLFDVRKRANKDNDYFCGRVVIDLSNIRPDTEYDTTMPLRVSSFVYDKRKRGVVRIRFSVHWFSEQAVVLSYLKGVQTIDDNNPLVDGMPTIPCADPRAFRNVAFTVHGQDLPGKYSKIAFRATVRELSLYQVNLRQMIIVCVLDVMFYENKLVSFYMFFASMYCVYCNSVAYIPATCVGYVLLQFLNNYRHYVIKDEFNFGYRPLMISELFRSLLQTKPNRGTDPKSICMRPMEVEKWTKRRAIDSKFKSVTEHGDDDKLILSDSKEIRPLDHREFPFSQRDAYPNFGVEDALAPGSTKGDAGRLHGRLSVYYSAPESGFVANANGNEDEESDPESDRDDETVLTESQMMGDDGFDMESASDEDDEADLEGTDYNYKRVAQAQKMAKGKTRLVQRVKLGPPQDSDVKGKKVPPQVSLKKMESLLYKLSRNVAVEFVHSGPQNAGEDVDIDTGMAPLPKELKQKMALKAKKAQADEYDKILGSTVSYTNPIQRIMSSFMGPVMRMMRVFIFIARICYNLSAWRDPILSFWLLVILVMLFFISLVFPWRSFFFLTSIAAMGPQNLFVRRILERKAREREKKNEACDESVSSSKSDMDSSQSGKKKKKKKGNALLLAFGGNKAKKSAFIKELYDNLDPKSRMAFGTSGPSIISKKTSCRAVVVPYARLKKDRFYDWPPDPTVSRATPVPIYEALHDDDSMTLSLPDIPMEEDDDYEDEDKPKNGLRQRKPTKEAPPGDFVPPVDIAF